MPTHPRLIEFDQDDDDTIRQRALQSAENGGPNSGFEMFGVQLFDENTLANTYPELKDDVDLVIATESYVRQLLSLHDQIQDQGGMNRGLAMELHRLVPDMQSFGMNRFTEESSLVNYEVSLESISGRLMALIGAAIAVLIGVIWKFVQWILGKRRGGSSGSNGVPGKIDFSKGAAEVLPVLDESKKASVESAEIAKTHGKLIEDAHKAHLDFPILPGLASTRSEPPFPKEFEIPKIKKLLEVSKKVKVDREGAEPMTVGVTLYELLNGRLDGTLKDRDLPSIERVNIDEEIVRYMRRPNPILVDGMTDGKLGKTMEAAIDMGEILARLLESNYTNIMALDQNLHRLGSSQDYAKVIVNIESIHRFDDLTWMGKKKMSLRDIVADMKTQFADKNVTYDKKFDLQDVAKLAITYTEKSRRADFYTKSRGFAEVLVKSGAPLQDLFNFVDNPKRPDDGAGRHQMFGRLRSLIVQMLQDVAAAVEYFGIIDNYEKEIMKFSRATFIMTQSGLQHLAQYFISRNLPIPPELEAVFSQYEISQKKSSLGVLSDVLHGAGIRKQIG